MSCKPNGHRKQTTYEKASPPVPYIDPPTKPSLSKRDLFRKIKNDLHGNGLLNRDSVLEVFDMNLNKIEPLRYIRPAENAGFRRSRHNEPADVGIYNIQASLDLENYMKMLTYGDKSIGLFGGNRTDHFINDKTEEIVKKAISSDEYKDKWIKIDDKVFIKVDTVKDITHNAKAVSVQYLFRESRKITDGISRVDSPTFVNFNRKIILENGKIDEDSRAYGFCSVLKTLAKTYIHNNYETRLGHQWLGGSFHYARGLIHMDEQTKRKIYDTIPLEKDEGIDPYLPIYSHVSIVGHVNSPDFSDDNLGPTFTKYIG